MDQQETQTNMEIYNKQYDKVNKNQKEVSMLYFDVRLKNIEQLRNFLLNLMILSSAIIVSVFPFLVKDVSYLKNLKLTIIGVVLLILVDLIGIFYINKILIRENKHLSEQNEFHINHMNEEIKMLLEVMGQKRNHEDWKEEYLNFLKNTVKEEKIMREKQEYKKIAKWFDRNFSNFLVYLMISGVILIGISFLNLDSISFWNNPVTSETETQYFICPIF
jgi:hypothetical protein